jgi:L-fucose isomerase-like protein
MQHEIIVKSIDKDKAIDTCYSQIAAGTFTSARVSTDDLKVRICAYVGEGEIVDQRLETFRGCGVAHISKLRSLLRYICENVFKHHVVVNHSQVSCRIYEALSNYLGWDMYLRVQTTPFLKNNH